MLENQHCQQKEQRLLGRRRGWGGVRRGECSLCPEKGSWAPGKVEADLNQDKQKAP